MNKYLIEILKIQNSVILPGLGALMVPSKKSGKIVFNEHLKFNDGSLAKFIAEKEGIDVQEAQNKVAKFIREIEAELGKGISYDMFEFGKFFKNSDGGVEFEMFSTSVMADPAEKTETASPVEKKKTILTPADILHEEKVAQEKETADKKEAEDKKAEEEKKAEEAKKAEEKEKEEADRKRKEATQKEEEKKSEKTKNTFKAEEDQKKSEKKSHEQTKKDKIVPPVVAAAKSDGKGTPDKHSKNKFTPAEEAEKAAEELKKQSKVAAETVSSSITEVNKKEDDAKKISAEKSKPESAPATEIKIEVEEKKKKSKLPWIILLLLLIGLAVLGYFYQEQILAYFNKGDEHSTEESVDQEVDETNDGMVDETKDGTDEFNNEIAEDSLETTFDDAEETLENQDVEEIIEEPTQEIAPSSSSGNYHLIGNSFSEKSNAENYVSEMKAKGYPAKILGRFDNLYMVSIKSYNSQSAAVSGIGSASSDASGAWVFKWPK